ncbi:HNH endonuclease [Eggerthella guodeyinii]|uniref:Putative HNH nuclease YajD n=1 Tax=Eggerthella guodeyinii TaxID=2690837 RepID=A0A6N7RLW4_9ACTN|nr:HNH endonuclease [Eggerthella guodeyinii]MRX82246.1 HNH endonuclease [Eggerthella guodeyinii]
MAKEFSDAFYHSGPWKRARREALIRDHGLCQHCAARGVVERAVMVHHVTELTPGNISDPRIATDLRNLVSLCDGCHKIIHGWTSAGRTRPGMAFDEDGNLVCVEETEHKFERR